MEPIANMRDSSTFVSSISSVNRVDEHARSSIRMELDLSPEKYRGDWKYHTPGNNSSKRKQREKSIIKNPFYILIMRQKYWRLIPPLLVR